MEALYPTEAELIAAARACGWPRAEVSICGQDRLVPLVPTEAAWRTFARWADGARRGAAYEALEEWEREMCAELDGAPR